LIRSDSKRWPTISHSFLLRFLLVVLFSTWIISNILHPAQDPDLWWHLASGRYIVMHRVIPTIDVFSWTAKGSPWVNSYWLYDTVLFWVFSRLAIAGVVIGHALLALLVFFLMAYRLHQKHVFWAVTTGALSLFFLLGAPSGYWPQASLVSIFFTSALLLLLDRWLEDPSTNTYWIGPLLFAVWANMHRGFLIGLLMASAYALVIFLQEKKRSLPILWVLLCILATLLTPYGAKLYTMMWTDMTLSSQLIMGWATPRFTDHPVLLGIVFLFWLTHLYDRWQRRAIPWPLVILAGVLTAGALRSIVFIPYFLLMAIPFLAQHVSRWMEAITKRYGFEKYDFGLGLLIGGLLLASLARAHPALGVQTLSFPVKAFDFIRTEKVTGAFYNDYAFGGYWMWAFGEDLPVFIDGRYPAVQGYISLVPEIQTAQRSPKAWKAFLDRYAINAALLKYYPDTPFPSLFEAIFPSSRWALVYWDDAGVLFLRRGAKNRAVIQAREFRVIRPDMKPEFFSRMLRETSPARRKDIRQELLRNLRLIPESRRTQRFLTFFEDSTTL
jgi:hypothetical protein